MEFGQGATSNTGLPGFMPAPRPLELGFRITAVDGGFFIQNFDPIAGNAVRVSVYQVQTYLTGLVWDKFNPTPNPETTNSDEQINEVGVKTAAETGAAPEVLAA